MNTLKLNQAQSAYLDFLRGLAAILVLLGHGSILFLNGGLFYKTHIQNGAVLVFFLLSGFLITYTVIRRYDDPSYTFKEFFIDRFSRIFSAFIPALLFVTVLDLYTSTIPFDWTVFNAASSTESTPAGWMSGINTGLTIQNWIGNLLMLQDFPLFQIARLAGVPDNVWFVRTFGSSTPFWTISIEWWIYMTFGMLVVIRLRNKKPFKFWQFILFGLVAIEPAYFLIGGTDQCLSLLWITGMAAAIALYNVNTLTAKFGWTFGSKKFMHGALFIAFCGFVFALGRLASLWIDAKKMGIGASIEFSELQFCIFLALTIFAFVFALASIKSIPNFFSKCAAFIANYSFSLYLTHASVLTFLYIRFPGHDHDSAFFWIAAGICNIVAIIFWWLFERHYHKVAKWLKVRFLPARGVA